MDPLSRGRRGHGHRGSRGPDRRGPDRRSQSTPPQQPRSDQVDVEQIMRDIRSRIAQQHGIDFTEQQIRELAARRLEAILDVRTVKPELLDQLRRAAADGRMTALPSRPAESPYQFEDSTLYESPRALMRGIRRLFHPILKLLFNPNPLIQALNLQARFNAEVEARQAEREQRYAEWNALHYEVLQRLVTEVARVSLEAQSLSLRVESLATKVDFNERRVRSMEAAAPEPGVRPAGGAIARTADDVSPQAGAGTEGPSLDAPRRRRRRRRGRRGGALPEGAGSSVAVGAPSTLRPADMQGEPPAEEDGGSVTTEGETITEDAESQPISPTAAASVEESQPRIEQPANPHIEPTVPDFPPVSDPDAGEE